MFTERCFNLQDIHSLLIATNAEREILVYMENYENDGDTHDPIVESWEKRLKQGFTVEFEDMRAADVEGRKMKADDVDKEAGGKKPTLDQVIEAMGTVTDQLNLINTAMGEMDDRLKGVEVDLAVLKRNLNS